jgi:hypothetical protein
MAQTRSWEIIIDNASHLSRESGSGPAGVLEEKRWILAMLRH